MTFCCAREQNIWVFPSVKKIYLSLPKIFLSGIMNYWVRPSVKKVLIEPRRVPGVAGRCLRHCWYLFKKLKYYQLKECALVDTVRISHTICDSDGGDCDEGRSGSSGGGCGSIKLFLSFSLLCVSIIASMLVSITTTDSLRTSDFNSYFSALYISRSLHFCSLYSYSLHFQLFIMPFIIPALEIVEII